MGYYTNYVIKAKDVYNPEIENFISKFLEETYAPFYHSFINEWSIDETKWYDHTEHMRLLSNKPEVKDVLFRVTGEGEDRDDSWVQYFRNGKMAEYRSKITWPDFSEDDLN